MKKIETLNFNIEVSQRTFQMSIPLVLQILLGFIFIGSNSQRASLTAPFDIGLQWTVDHFPNVSQANNSLRFTTYYFNNQISTSQWIVSYLERPNQIRATNRSGTFIVATISLTGNIKFFTVLNNKLNPLLCPNITVSNLIFGTTANTAYASTSQTIYRINFDTQQIDRIWEVDSSLKLLKLRGDQDNFFGLLTDNTYCYLQFFNPDLSLRITGKHPSTFLPTSQKGIVFQNISGRFGILTSTNIEIWVFPSLGKTLSFSQTTSTSVYGKYPYEKGIFCNQLYFSLSNCGYNVYNIPNMSGSKNSDAVNLVCSPKFPINGTMIGFTACYLNAKTIGALFSNGTQVHSILIDIATPAFSSKISIIVPTGLSTQTTKGNTAISNISDLACPVLPKKKQAVENPLAYLSSETLALNSATEMLAGALTSEAAQNSSKAGSSVVGVASSISIVQPFFRPFTCFLQDMWFYSFHNIQYPDFVNNFTSQVDILNELRLKPQFLNFNFEIDPIDEANQRQVKLGFLHSKAPDNQFMLKSTKDIYTSNLAMCLISYVVIKVIFYIARALQEKHEIFKTIYMALTPKHKWWSLLISFLEVSITPVSFNAGIQLNSFLSFGMLSKVNLMVTLLMFFVVLTYAILFYPLFSHFGSQLSCRKVSDLSEGTPNSLWLEGYVKCLRPFLIAFVHGLFLNYNKWQLVSLSVVQLLIIGLMIKNQRYFQYRAVFISYLLYVLLMLIFDISLAAYSFNLKHIQTEIIYKIYFGFETSILIVSILVVSLLKAFVSIAIFIKQLDYCTCCNNKIHDQPSSKQQIKQKITNSESQKKKTNETQINQRNNQKLNQKRFRRKGVLNAVSQSKKEFSDIDKKKCKPFRPNYNKK